MGTLGCRNKVNANVLLVNAYKMHKGTYILLIYYLGGSYHISFGFLLDLDLSTIKLVEFKIFLVLFKYYCHVFISFKDL
jgi:hypothetical protein